MTKQVINVGSGPNSKTGDPLRTAFIKINENFTELYNANTTPSVTIDVPGAGGANGSEVILDLTKQVQVLQSGWYKLDAGTEGQIMYFVPSSTVTALSAIQIRVNNGRYNDGTTVIDYVNNYITPFSVQAGATIAIAIYADGAWNFNQGLWD